MEPRIKEFLKRVRMTQYDLAEKLGCNQSLVAAWATGSGLPTFDKICQLIDLGISPTELFGEERAQKLLVFGNRPNYVPKDFDTPEFNAGVEKQVLEILKRKGLL